MGKLNIKVFNLSYRTKTELEEALAVRLREREEQLGAGFCRTVQIIGSCKAPDSPDRHIASILESIWTGEDYDASRDIRDIRDVHVKSFSVSYMTLNELEMELNVRLQQWEETLGGHSCFSVQITSAAKDPDDSRRHIVSVLAAFR